MLFFFFFQDITLEESEETLGATGAGPPPPPVLVTYLARKCQGLAPPCEGETHLSAWLLQEDRQEAKGEDGAPRKAGPGETPRTAVWAESVQGASPPRPRRRREPQPRPGSERRQCQARGWRRARTPARALPPRLAPSSSRASAAQAPEVSGPKGCAGPSRRQEAAPPLARGRGDGRGLGARLRARALGPQSRISCSGRWGVQGLAGGGR